MKQVLTIAFATFVTGASGLAGYAQATDGATPAHDSEVTEVVEVETGPMGMPMYDAADVQLSEFLWVSRLIVVFADTPNDPSFGRQIEFILEREAAMVERDVVLITDSDPAARSEARRLLRPRGFMMAIIDKDGEVKQRRPSPRDGREIMQTIDKFPSRREEFLQQNPSGRQ